MPWCDGCSKFWNPPEMGRGGKCPTCGSVLAAPGDRDRGARVTSPLRGGLATSAPPRESLSLRPATPRRSRDASQAVALPGGPVAPSSSGSPPGAGGAPNPAGASNPAGAAAKAKGAPWHFKLLVVGVTVYMIYRIYWLIEWLPKHI